MLHEPIIACLACYWPFTSTGVFPSLPFPTDEDVSEKAGPGVSYAKTG